MGPVGYIRVPTLYITTLYRRWLPHTALPLETAERAFTWKSSIMEFWLSIRVCPYVTLGNLLPPSG